MALGVLEIYGWVEGIACEQWCAVQDAGHCRFEAPSAFRCDLPGEGTDGQ